MEQTLEDILTERIAARLLPLMEERLAQARQHPAAESLRELRERKGISVDDAAAQAHMTNHYLNKLERGEYTPTAPTLAALARSLGVSTTDCAAAAESVYRNKQRLARKANKE